MHPSSNNERGQALILIVFAIIGLIGMTALTIDGGNAYSDRRHAQNAADTAVLAGARALIRAEDWKLASVTIANANGYLDADDTVDTTAALSNVEVYQCDDGDPIVDCGVYDGDSNHIQVKITSTVNTYFGRVVGIQQLTNIVTAIAQVIPGTYEEMFDGNALVGLAPSACPGVDLQGTAETIVTGGGIYVNSSCTGTVGAFRNQSGDAELSSPSICAVGDVEQEGLNVPSISEGCDPVGFPPDNIVMPNISCGTNISSKTGNIMSPGAWTGDFPPAGAEFLQSGVYCIDGDFKLGASDTVVGNNVVFLVNGDIDMQGSPEVNLDAPDSGPYEGLLFYVPLDTPVSQTVTINGNSTSTFAGTILAPSSHCKINGTGNMQELSGQVICYTITMEGTGEININYNDVENYNSLTRPEMELTK